MKAESHEISEKSHEISYYTIFLKFHMRMCLKFSKLEWAWAHMWIFCISVSFHMYKHGHTCNGIAANDTATELFCITACDMKSHMFGYVAKNHG